MAAGNRRKCKCCRTLFRPDPRNRRHQRYCSAASCRAASKAASQHVDVTRRDRAVVALGYLRPADLWRNEGDAGRVSAGRDRTGGRLTCHASRLASLLHTLTSPIVGTDESLGLAAKWGF